MVLLGRLAEANITMPHWQKIVSGFILDLAFPKDKLVVEVDGPYHATAEQRRRDARRSAVLESAGWTVRRLTDGEVFRDPAAAAARVIVWLDEARYREESEYLESAPCWSPKRRGLGVADAPKLNRAPCLKKLPSR